MNHVRIFSLAQTSFLWDFELVIFPQLTFKSDIKIQNQFAVISKWWMMFGQRNYCSNYSQYSLWIFLSWKATSRSPDDRKFLQPACKYEGSKEISFEGLKVPLHQRKHSGCNWKQFQDNNATSMDRLSVFLRWKTWE